MKNILPSSRIEIDAPKTHDKITNPIEEDLALKAIIECKEPYLSVAKMLVIQEGNVCVIFGKYIKVRRAISKPCF